MKMFNKNRKSFGNNNRRNDRNNSYRSNDRNKKFSRPNGGRNKFIKSEQLNEEDATPWHVMKQNLKPSIAIKNPEIEDDWNTEEKQKFRAAKQEFMRQKDERHRKFVIENERQTLSKWDSFSDIELSDDQAKNTFNTSDESEEKQIFDEVEHIESKIKETVSEEQISKRSKKNKSRQSEESPASKKIKVKHVKSSLETVTESEIDQSLLVKKKLKKTKQTESPQETIIETKTEHPVKAKKNAKTANQAQPSQESVIEIEMDQPMLVKKKFKKTIKQAEAHQETITENKIGQPAITKKKFKKSANQEKPPPEIVIKSIIEQPVLDKKKSTKTTKHVDVSDDATEQLDSKTFLESLASQKQNEPFLFESTEITKSGPRCFACRQFGHSLKQCRDFDNASTRICIKCGSNEHAYQNCTVHKGRVFKFASCFICKQTGHISSQCKEKKNGVYPDGGNCRYCSSVEHLGFDCPRRPGRKKKRKFSKNRNSKPNDKFRKVQNGGGGGSGRIQKDKIKKTF